MTEFDIQAIWQQQPEVLPIPATGEPQAILTKVWAAEHQRRRLLRWLPLLGGGMLLGLRFIYQAVKLVHPPHLGLGIGLLALGLGWMVAQNYYTRLPITGPFEQPTQVFRAVVRQSLNLRRKLLIWGALPYLILLLASLHLLVLPYIPLLHAGWVEAVIAGYLIVITGWSIQQSLRRFDQLYGPLLQHFTVDNLFVNSAKQSV
jgi:hypothetical protein